MRRFLSAGSLFCVLAIVLWFVFGWKGLTVLALVVGAIGVIGTFFWFILAPRNYFFTFVTEGTAKIIVKAGGFFKALIQWKGYTLDEDQNVVPENEWVKNGEVVAEGTPGAKKYREPWHPFGGLRWVGIWPVFQIYLYRLRWTSVREDGSYSPHDEVLDYVMLKDHIYLVKLRGAEDTDMVPLDVDLLLTMRVTNPYKAIFRVQDWIELVTGRTMPFFRQYVGENTFKELKSKTQEAGGEVWQRLDALVSGRPSLIDEFKIDYGAQIKEGGVEMKEVTPPKEYQEAATRKYMSEREREKRMVETVGTVLESLAYSQGKNVSQVQTEIAADATLQKLFLEIARDMVMRQVAIAGKSFIDIRTEGAGEGLDKTILNALALWSKISGGSKGGKQQKEVKSKKQGAISAPEEKEED